MDSMESTIRDLVAAAVAEHIAGATGAGLLHSHFLAQPIETEGRSPTLTTRLGAALLAAERRFGPRDMSWTLLGWEIGPTNPRMWHRWPPEGKQIVIQLSDAARLDEAQAVFQLAHECVHVLSPGDKTVNALEEGVASAFSEDWVLQETGRRLVYSSDAYAGACRNVRGLLAIDDVAVRKLRAVEPAFSKMTRETFTTAGLNVPDELIAALLTPFVRQVDG